MLGYAVNNSEKEKELLTIRDTMKLLSCGRNTILNMIHDGILEAHLVGGKYLLFREEVLEYVINS